MDRRTLLKTSGAVAALGALTWFPVFPRDEQRPGTVRGNQSTPVETTSKQPSSAPDGSKDSYRDEIGFERVLNAVDDLGMDDSGEAPIDEAIDSNLENGTLIEFPPGDYLTTQRHTVSDLAKWGIRGTSTDRSEVQIRTQEGAGHVFLNIRSGRDILVENVTFDARSGRQEWLSNILKLADGLRVNKVEYAGFYASEITGKKANPSGNIEGPLHVHITESDGVGIIDRFVRRGPTHHAEYPAGTSCIFVGPAETVGTVYLRNSHIENMSSHGIYASRTQGDIRIENSTFKNNNGAGVRISGSDSYIRNSDIIIDGRDIIDGTIGNVFTSLTSGMWFESGFRTQAGGTMDGCRIDVRNAPDLTKGIEIDGSAGRTLIRKTDVFTGSGDLRPIDINEPGQAGARVRTGGSVPEDPRVAIQGVTITGQSSGPDAVIDVSSRDGVSVSQTSIEFEGARDGIRFTDVSGYAVDETSIRLAGFGTGIVVQDSTDGSVTASEILVRGVPLEVRTSTTPEKCPVRFDAETVLQTNRYDVLIDTRLPNSIVTHPSTAGCIEYGSALEGGGQVLVLRKDKEETVLLMQN